MPESRKQQEWRQRWDKRKRNIANFGTPPPKSCYSSPAPPAPLALTEEVSRDGALQVNVFGTIAVIELSSDKSMQVEVEWLQLVVEMLQVILEGGGVIPGAPVAACVFKSCREAVMTPGFNPKGLPPHPSPRAGTAEHLWEFYSYLKVSTPGQGGKWKFFVFGMGRGGYHTALIPTPGPPHIPHPARTVHLIRLVAQRHELLVLGTQWVACSVVPTLPGVEELLVAAGGGHDV